MLFLLLLFTVPIILTSAFILELTEKFHLHWVWVILTGLFALVFIYVFWSEFITFLEIPLVTWFVGYLGFGCIIIAILVNMYLFISLWNLYAVKKTKVDYLIVLGAGLNEFKVTPLLGQRIDHALTLYWKQPGVKLIMSGGQGDDEIISEGLAMARYAIEQGVPESDILIENKSVNTEENILFSSQLMASLHQRIGIVSTHYHILRALIIARDLRLNAVGFGAPAKKPAVFTLNAFVREFFAYLYMRLTWTISISIIYSIIYCLFHYAARLNAFSFMV